MRTQSLRRYAPILSVLTLLVTAVPAAAATLQQAAARRVTPPWVWLLLLLAIVLLVWWLWNGLRPKADYRHSVAAQPKLPESLGEAIAQAPAGSERAGVAPATAEIAVAPAQLNPAPAAAVEPPAAAPAPEPPAETPKGARTEPEPAPENPAPKEEELTQEKPIEADRPQATAEPALAQRSAPETDVLAAAVAAAPVEDEPAAKRSRSAKKRGDDLTVVEGIGPKISAVLQQAGIDSYAALAATPVDDLRKLLADNNLRFADPSTWPEQAALAGTDSDKLAELQAKLKGGRRQ